MSEKDIKNVSGASKPTSIATEVKASPDSVPVEKLNVAKMPEITRSAVNRIKEIDIALKTGKGERKALLRFLQTQSNALTESQIKALIDRNYEVVTEQ